MHITTLATDHIPDEFSEWLPAERPHSAQWADPTQSGRERSDHYVVAFCDGVAAGLLALTIIATTAEVWFHYVQPELRDLGIGETLLEEGLRVVIEAGCSECVGWVAPGDRIAKLTYEAQGFRSDRIRVRRPL